MVQGVSATECTAQKVAPGTRCSGFTQAFDLVKQLMTNLNCKINFECKLYRTVFGNASQDLRNVLACL